MFRLVDVARLSRCEQAAIPVPPPSQHKGQEKEIEALGRGPMTSSVRNPHCEPRPSGHAPRAHVGDEASFLACATLTAYSKARALQLESSSTNAVLFSIVLLMELGFQAAAKPASFITARSGKP